MTRIPTDFLTPLRDSDPAIQGAIDRELKRQEDGLELIASENYVSRAVLEAAGSVLTNKYAEGYPKKRYYGGCEHVDEVESLAIERACKLFNSEAANVQPHSGSQANMATYLALMSPGDHLLGMDLSHGGHLTHGSPANFSGKLFSVSSYGLNPDTHRIDLELVRKKALETKPKVIVAGASAYPRIIDFEALGKIARESGAELVVDIAHIAGLIAAGLHPSPIPHATYTTTTTHKTLRGPRGGMILGRTDRIQAVNKWIFPGIQGGPLMHIIAAKAVCFGEALKPGFLEYQKSIIANARTLADALIARGLTLVTGGTDNHLMLVDLTRFGDGSLTGKDAERWLESAAITVNKNTVPNEKRSPFVTSGLRIGVPAITTRGMGNDEMKKIGKWIGDCLRSKGDEGSLATIRSQVLSLCHEFPLYKDGLR